MVNSLKILLMLYSKTEKIAYLYLSLIRFRRLSENLLHHFSNSLLQKVLEAESSPTVCLFCLYSSAEIALNIIKVLFLPKIEVFFGFVYLVAIYNYQSVEGLHV